MFKSLGAVALMGAITVVNAATHEIIVGTFGPPFLYSLEFDDEALTLELVANTTVPAPSSWISFNHNKSTLYGNHFSGTAFSSYSLANGSSFTLTGTVLTGEEANCTAPSIYQVADPNPPYALYGAYFGSAGTATCGTVMSVDETGALVETIQNFTYQTTSGVHGSAISPDSKFLYSADDSGNALWTHSIDPSTGEVTLVDVAEYPTAGGDPRHVAVHPNGSYIYVVLEGISEVAQYSLDNTTGLPTLINETYSLLTAGLNATDYWADEVALSPSGKYLWATNRGRTANGFISVFTLAEDGAIAGQNFLIETTSSGGDANAVTPSPFSDRFVALTDSASGFVEIWELSENATSAAVVAHLDIVDSDTQPLSCCANAIWYS